MKLIMVNCGMAVKRMGMCRVSVRKMKALTVKMETTLVGKDRQNLTCFVYEVYEINSKIFLADLFFFSFFLSFFFSLPAGGVAVILD